MFRATQRMNVVLNRQRRSFSDSVQKKPTGWGTGNPWNYNVGGTVVGAFAGATFLSEPDGLPDFFGGILGATGGSFLAEAAPVVTRTFLYPLGVGFCLATLWRKYSPVMPTRDGASPRSTRSKRDADDS